VKGTSQVKFAFEAQLWNQTIKRTFNLNKVFRQKDQRKEEDISGTAYMLSVLQNLLTCSTRCVSGDFRNNQLAGSSLCHDLLTTMMVWEQPSCQSSVEFDGRVN
jgi:hypothetical protein